MVSLHILFMLAAPLIQSIWAFPMVPRENNIAGCSSLATAFPTQLFYPNTTTYTDESKHLWSQTCLLSPYCVFRPNDAKDIASALKILVRENSQFAIRGQGHMPVPGAASTDSGVMIAMSNFQTRKLIERNTIAQLGPGQNWVSVYDWLNPYGLAVPGGRYGPVGVAGLLLGGGINYFGNDHGWSSNSVVACEIVLANSSIVEVNSASHPDLLWALKGGSNNYGIVTRFDMKTIPVSTVFGGVIANGIGCVPAMVDALTSFVQPEGGIEDPLAAINPTIGFLPAGTCSNVVLHRGNDPNPASLSKFTSLPNTTFSDVSLRNFSALPDELSAANSGGGGLRVLFWSTAIKPTAEAIAIVNTTITQAALTQLGNVSNATVFWSPQPINKSWLQAAVDAGGDAIDGDPAKGSFISSLLTTGWTDPKDDVFMNDFSRKLTATIDAKTKAAGLYYPSIYLNDAGKGQNPFVLYGGGKSLPRMLAIRKKYDPEGIFQKYEASGFKLTS